MLKENWTSKEQTIPTARLMLLKKAQMTEIQKDYCSVESLALMRAQKKVLKMGCYSVESLALRKVQMTVLTKAAMTAVMRVSKTAETRECLILMVQLIKMVGLFETQLML